MTPEDPRPHEPASPRAKALKDALAQSDPRSDELRSRKRVSILAFGASALLAVLLGRMLFLQSLPSEDILDRTEQNSVRRPLASFRGALIDRHGRVLAASQLRHRLCLDPQVVRDSVTTAVENTWPARQQLSKKGLAAVPEQLLPRLTPEFRRALESRDAGLINEAFEEFIRRESEEPLRAALAALPGNLAKALHMSADDAKRLAERIKGREHKSYVVLSDLLDKSQADTMRELRGARKEPFPGFKGLFLEARSLRQYPQGDTAGQLVGFTGKEEVLPDGRRQEKGLDGLEKLWNARLQSTDGSSEWVVDKHRRPVWVSSEGYRLPKDGENILLSIDSHIQEIAEKQLEITCTKNHVESGILVVMQPYTGEILAMANWPKFDPSARYGLAQRLQLARNRAVADSFEPGSIFKPMVWASLVDDGYMKPEEKVDTTTEGAYRLASGRLLHDADAARGHGHGITDWNGVLAMSSNIGMAKGGAKTKNAWLHDALEKWGFGHSTQSGLPGEASGILRQARKWDKYTPSSLTMGQSINVTALQIMRAYGAIANGGQLLIPITEALDGPKTEQPARVRVISEDTAAKTRKAMRLVMTHEHGTGRQANSKYYDIFGKTGTAQLPDLATKRYGNYYVSSFVGGAPLDHPRLVAGCFLRKTKKGRHFGGVVAAPYVKNTLEASLIYLGVPTNPGTDPSKMYLEWEADVKKRSDEAGLDYD